jgi:hypothetical protein
LIESVGSELVRLLRGVNMCAIAIDEFLTTYVEGFLLGDLRRLAVIGEETRGAGALFYPALMTICSGMELLGAIDSDQPFSPRDKGGDYFKRGWSLTYDERLRLPDEVTHHYYQCVRHGLAHLFLPKGKIAAIGEPAAEPLHLTMVGEMLILHVPKMCRDCERAYHAYFRGPNVVSRQAIWELRANEIVDHLACHTLFVPPISSRQFVIGRTLPPTSIAPGAQYTR